MFVTRTQVTKVMTFSVFQSACLLLVVSYSFPRILILTFPSSSIEGWCPCYEKSEPRVCRSYNKDFRTFNVCCYRYLVLLEYGMFLREEVGLTRNYRVRFLTARHTVPNWERPPSSLSIQFLVVLPSCPGE